MTDSSDNASLKSTNARSTLRRLLYDKRAHKPSMYLTPLQEIAKEAAIGEKDPSICYPSSPVGALQNSNGPDQSLYGISIHYYSKIGADVAVEDFADYFACVELIPSPFIAHELLFFMFDSVFSSDDEALKKGFVDSVPYFLSEGEWRGGKSMLLLLRVAFDCLGERPYAGELIKCLLASREGKEKAALAVVAVSHIVYLLQGDIAESKEDRYGRRNKFKDRVFGLYKSIEPQIPDLLPFVDIEMLSVLFGLDSANGDAAELSRFRETGALPSGINRPYAQALMLARLIDAVLSQSEWTLLLSRSLTFPDRSQYWEIKAHKSLGIYAGAVVAQADNPMKIWTDCRANWNQRIYRTLHEYNKASSNYAAETIFDAYLSTAVCAIDNLLYRPQMRGAGNNTPTDTDMGTAFAIWQDAWNDCETALYSRFLPTTAFHMIQVLFVYAALKFSRYRRLDLIYLLDRLPVVELQQIGRQDVRNACLKTLHSNREGNLADYKAAQAAYPELFLIVDSAASSASPTLSNGVYQPPEMGVRLSRHRV